jgi:hypothetical protein
MAAFLSNLRNVVIAGFVLALIVLGIRWQQGGLAYNSADLWEFIIRWLHVHLRRDVDRVALVFQLRLHADHAENSR